MREKVESIYQKFHEKLSELDNAPASNESSQFSDDGPHPAKKMKLGDFDIDKWRFEEDVTEDDELKRYLKAPRALVRTIPLSAHEFDIMTWWQEHTEDYPVLSHIAFEIFSISSMSAEVKRIFSEFVPLFSPILIHT